MAKLKKNKHGFTLTELAIVIAVIAILIAVLVPTFISLINKANESVDEQNVKNMNTALSAEVENEPDCLCEVWKILSNSGYNPTPTPASSANEFYWYITENRIVIVSDGAVTFPSEYTSVNFTDDETVFMKLDTDEDSASAHYYDYSLGYCTACGEKVAATKVSTSEDFATQITATGNVKLTGDISFTGTTSLVSESTLSEVSIDLNGYSITTERNASGNGGMTIEYDSAADAPTSITITNGTVTFDEKIIDAFYILNATSVNFSNVTFVCTDNTYFSTAIRFNITDDSNVYNYTFQSCNFVNTYVYFKSDASSCYEVNATFTSCNFTATLNSTKNSAGSVMYCQYIYGNEEFNNCNFTITTAANNTGAIYIPHSKSDIPGHKLTITLNNVIYTGTNNGYDPKLIYMGKTFKNKGTDLYEIIETGTNSYKNDGVAVDWYGNTI